MSRNQTPAPAVATGAATLRDDVSMLLFELIIAGIALAGAALLSFAR